MFSKSCCTKGTHIPSLSQIPTRRRLNSLRNKAIRNLLLAASARLGHIRRNGAVAERLKAAVC
jgi:hypothetical protein